MHNRRIKSKALALCLSGVMVGSYVDGVYATNNISETKEVGNKTQENEETLRAKKEFDDYLSKQVIIGDITLKDLWYSKEPFSTNEYIEKRLISNYNSNTLKVENYATSFAGGDGTEVAPYQISNAEELARLAYLINEDNLDTTGMYFELTSDIDLSTFDVDSDDTNGNWIPIGLRDASSNIYYFKGTLKGNNFKIKNMNIDTNTISVGLFGYTDGASITDLVIEDAVINKGSNIGALVGYAKGKLNTSNIEIINFDSSVDAYKNVGGIVGYTYSADLSIVDTKITNIKLKGNNIGGVVGYLTDASLLVDGLVVDGLLTGSKIMGSYCGGVVGDASGNSNPTVKIEIKNAEILSDIVSSRDYTYIGGLMGRYMSFSSSTKSTMVLSNNKIKNSMKSEDAGSVVYNVGGLVSNLIVNGGSSLIVENNDIEIVELDGEYVGGAVASLTCMNSTANIKNNNIKFNSDIKVKYYGGGLIGYSNSTDGLINIQDIKIIGSKIVQFFQNSSIYMGGLIGAGYCSSETYTVDNVDLEIDLETDKATYTFLGGLSGYISSDLSIDNSRIRVNIEDKNTAPGTSNMYTVAGGFLGFGGSNNEVNINKSYYKGNIHSGAVAGYIGKLYDTSITKVNIKDTYVQGKFDGDLMSNGFFWVNTKGATTDVNIETSYIAVDLVSDNGEKNTISNLIEDDIVYTNVYYDKIKAGEVTTKANRGTVSGLTGLSTDEMMGKGTKTNMLLDYNNVWYANKETYPLFEQLNTAPEIITVDFEINLYDEFKAMDYLVVDDFESVPDKLIKRVVRDEVKTDTRGTYEVEYEVEDEQGLKGTKIVNVTVVGNYKPVITAEDIEIKQGSVFNAKDYATAYDEEDGPITDRIKVKEDKVKPNEVGEYTVTYEVEDDFGHVVTKTITVKVIANPTNGNTGGGTNGSGNNGSGTNGSGNNGSENNGSSTDKDEDKDTVDKDEDKDTTDKDNDKDEDKDDTNKDDDSIVKNEKPIIIATDRVISLGTKVDLLDGVTAYDDDDGDLTDKIVLDIGDLDIFKEGVYDVMYTVEDSGGIKVSVIVKVTVVNPTQEDKVENNIVIKVEDKVINKGDVFKPLEGVTANNNGVDITDKIEVIKNEVDTTKEGTYEVVYTVVIDNQEYKKTIKVQVVSKEDEKAEDTDTDKTDSTSDANKDSDKNTEDTDEVVKTGDNAFLHLFVLMGSLCSSVLLFLKLKKKK